MVDTVRNSEPTIRQFCRNVSNSARVELCRSSRFFRRRPLCSSDEKIPMCLDCVCGEIGSLARLMKFIGQYQWIAPGVWTGISTLRELDHEIAVLQV